MTTPKKKVLIRKDALFAKHKPDPHQVISLAHAEQQDNVLDFSDAGTGKTPVALWAYAKRKQARKAKCALVICPRTLTTNVWESSIRKFTPHLTCTVARADNRAKAFAEDVDVYITNTDAVAWLVKQPKKFFDKFTELIIDESSAFKHHTSQRSKAAARIRRFFTHTRLMSGTPRTRSITDVWHQALICDEGKTLGNSFYAFRNSVSVPQQVGRNKNAIRWEDKEGADEAVFGLLADIVIRHEFDKVVKIPERRVYTVPYSMTTKHAKSYFEMEKNQFLWYQDKAKVGSVTAIHAAIVRQKLMQIASGAVYGDRSTDDDKPTVVFDDGRYELVMELALQSPHTLIMFLWKHQRDSLVRLAEAKGLSFAVIDGNTPDKVREQFERDYQAGVYDIAIAHPKTVAHGLTLTLGSTTVWASPTDDTEWFKQGNRRQARRGQTQETRVVTVIAEGTVDEAVYANCIRKGDKEDEFLKYFERHTTEEHS